jgi:RNA polymerase sigma factor (sigma-70 family)
LQKVRNALPLRVVHNPLAHLDDFQLVQRCLDGNEPAVLELQRCCGPVVEAFLIGKGAANQEAEELVGQLWADCLVAKSGQVPRIARYDGSCKLTTWLNIVALNRLLTVRRKENRVRVDSLDAAVGGEDGLAPIDVIPADPPHSADQPLVQLLKEAIEAGFRACTPQQFVMLSLAYGDGLKLSDLATMWRVNASTISRWLEQAREAVRSGALAYLQKHDAMIDLSWDDFLQICGNASLGALGFD